MSKAKGCKDFFRSALFMPVYQKLIKLMRSMRAREIIFPEGVESREILLRMFKIVNGGICEAIEKSNQFKWMPPKGYILYLFRRNFQGRDWYLLRIRSWDIVFTIDREKISIRKQEKIPYEILGELRVKIWDQ